MQSFTFLKPSTLFEFTQYIFDDLSLQMQRAEMEELRQREANLTALQAIGPRKKPKLDLAGSSNNSGNNSGANALSTGMNRQMPLRPRLKRVNFRDLLFLLEQEKETCRTTTLYKSYLK